MEPAAVNLTEFWRRFMRIWVMRPLSPSSGGRSMEIWLRRTTPRWRSGATSASTSDMASHRLTEPSLTLSVLRFVDAASRMSFTRRFSRHPQLRIMERLFLTAAEALVSCMSESVSPIIPMSGVRSSCVTDATSESCAMFAARRSDCTFLSSLMSYSFTKSPSLPVSGFVHGTNTMRCHTIPLFCCALAESAAFGVLLHSNCSGFDCSVSSCRL
mmetsp:Transcript_24180/g.57678  ORF Transcript_24180/g.57678 Transcript_24180/m.57678 type:complete len:214 (+) Transcript_24180:353-994(+)